MQSRPFTYLFYIQYLGLRYSGWQKQKGVKTVEGTIERGIRYVLGHEDFTLLGASRTDAGVSCEKGACQLFLKSPLEDADFLKEVNKNLPSDIRLLTMQKVQSTFNIIQDVDWKEYHYFMAFDEKFHPFAAAKLSYFSGKPDIEMMQKGAQLFEGKHDFRQYCSLDKNTNDFEREVFASEITSHPSAGEGLVPGNALVFKIKGNGFLRYQVRIMANALVELGLGRLSLDEIKASLNPQSRKPIAQHAASNGLVLYNLAFRNL
jgi:tRNA pseudouridine38-40 synthase